MEESSISGSCEKVDLASRGGTRGGVVNDPDTTITYIDIEDFWLELSSGAHLASTSPSTSRVLWTSIGGIYN